jgi:adenylate kinase
VARRAALSGTPGTGKTTVARLLARERSTVEVGDLALRSGWGRRGTHGVEVDLRGLRRELRRRPRVFGADLVVGHLAHLLPVRDVIVLRCQPVELGRRLESSGRGDLKSRHENLLAEALNVVTAEAVARRRTVFEVDTTGRTPARVAREVSDWLAGERRPQWGRVDWLRDPAVTEHLLDWTG